MSCFWDVSLLWFSNSFFFSFKSNLCVIWSAIPQMIFNSFFFSFFTLVYKIMPTFISSHTCSTLTTIASSYKALSIFSRFAQYNCDRLSFACVSYYFYTYYILYSRVICSKFFISYWTIFIYFFPTLEPKYHPPFPLCPSPNNPNEWTSPANSSPSNSLESVLYPHRHNHSYVLRLGCLEHCNSFLMTISQYLIHPSNCRATIPNRQVNYTIFLHEIRKLFPIRVRCHLIE